MTDPTKPSPTLAALLALLDEREPLDVGPCPACVERGGGWEWAQRQFGSDALWSNGAQWMDGHDPSPAILPSLQGGWSCKWVNHGQQKEWLAAIRPCPECSEPHDVECGCWEASDGKRMRTVTEGSEGAPRVAECRDCDGTGKRPGPPRPTGLDRRTPGQALRDALGLRWDNVAGARGEEEARRWARAYAPSPWRVRRAGTGWIVQRLARSGTPDPAARDALTVYADALQARGDLLGQAIALALAGECRECRGSGWANSPELISGVSVDVGTGRCQATVCGGDLVRLGDLIRVRGDMYAVVKCTVHGNTRADAYAALELEPLGSNMAADLADIDLTPPCPKCNGEGAAVGELAAELRIEALDKSGMLAERAAVDLRRMEATA